MSDKKQLWAIKTMSDYFYKVAIKLLLWGDNKIITTLSRLNKSDKLRKEGKFHKKTTDITAENSWYHCKFIVVYYLQTSDQNFVEY